VTLTAISNYLTHNIRLSVQKLLRLRKSKVCV